MQTEIGNSQSRIEKESRSMSLKGQILQSLKTSKEYRRAFIEESVRTSLAIQIKTIREQREMSRPELARAMHKSPSWIFRLEDPNEPPPTVTTLLQVADAYDTDLHISFGSFTSLLDRVEKLSPESFKTASFDEELPGLEKQLKEQERAKIAAATALQPPRSRNLKSLSSGLYDEDLNAFLYVPADIARFNLKDLAEPARCREQLTGLATENPDAHIFRRIQSESANAIQAYIISHPEGLQGLTSTYNLETSEFSEPVTTSSLDLQIVYRNPNLEWRVSKSSEVRGGIEYGATSTAEERTA